MTKEFCDICGRPIETHKNVSKFKLKKAVHTFRERMLAGGNCVSKSQISRLHMSQWRTTNEMLLS